MAFILTFRERGNSWAGRGPFSTEYPTREEAHAALVEYVGDADLAARVEAARRCAEGYLESRKAQNFPLIKKK